MLTTGLEKFGQLIDDVRAGRKSLATAEATSDFVYSGQEAADLIAASLEAFPSKSICLDGEITGRLTVDCSIQGSLRIPASLDDLAVTGEIRQDLHISGTVKSTVDILGTVGTLGVTGYVHYLYVRADSVVGDLVVSESGRVADVFDVEGKLGSVTISGAVRRGVRLRPKAKVEGNLTIEGFVDEGVQIFCLVAGDVRVRGKSGPETISIFESAKIGGDLIQENLGTDLVAISGEIGGRVHLHGPVGTVQIFEPSKINGDVFVSGEVARNIDVHGDISGLLAVSGEVGKKGDGEGGTPTSGQGSIQGSIRVSGRVNGEFQIVNIVHGGVTLSGRISGNTSIRVPGRVFGDLLLSGTFGGSVDLRVAQFPKMQVASVSGAAFEGPVFFGEGVSLQKCSFKSLGDSSQFRFLGSDLFRVEHGRNVIDESQITEPEELAAVYRELRQVFEGQSNRPEAGDFYYGEMNARLRGVRPSQLLTLVKRMGLSDWFGGLKLVSSRSGLLVVLSLYWMMSGYGQKFGRALFSFFLVAIVGSLLFYHNGLEITFVENVDGTRDPRFVQANYPETFLFTVRSMVSFFSPPEAYLGAWGSWLQILLRFLGPVILAQAVVSVRERVAR